MSQSKAMRQSPIVWVAILVACAALVAIAVGTGGSDDASPTTTTLGPTVSETASVTLTGAPLPRFEEADKAIGLQAPAVSGSSFDGSAVAFGDDGTARLIGFFAHWCPHCQNELPATAEWLAENPLPDGVEVIAVSTGINPDAENFPPSDWFRNEHWAARVIADDAESTIAIGFGLAAFPFWVAVDSDGLVVSRAAGTLNEAQFEAMLDAIDPN